MDDEGAKDLWRLGLHREPENDQVWRGWVGQSFSHGSDEFRKSDEWLGQNHVLLVAYPELGKQLTDANAALADANAKLTALTQQDTIDKAQVVDLQKQVADATAQAASAKAELDKLQAQTSVPDTTPTPDPTPGPSVPQQSFWDWLKSIFTKK